MDPQSVSDETLGQVRRVTVLWLGRIGDLVVSTPLLAALKARFPGSSLRLVVGEAAREAGPLCPGVDQTLVLGRAWAAADNARLALELLSRPCDLLIDMNGAPSRSGAALAWLASARVKLGFDKRGASAVLTHRLPAPGESEHMLDRYGRVAAALRAPYDPVPRVRWTPEDEAAAKRVLAALGPGEGPLVAVHPGNFGKFDNRWPEDRFVEVLKRLKTRGGARPVLLTGPGEERPVRDIALAAAVPALPAMPLGHAAALLSLCGLFIGNATGTAHLAAAAGAPTFTFLNRYTKTVWMPRSGPHHGVLSDSWDSCRDIPVEAAWSALEEVLSALAPRPR